MRLDRTTVLGLTAAIGLLLAVMLAGAGESVGVYWQTSSMLLVLGGSLLATLVSHPWSQFRSIGAVARKTVYEQASTQLESIGTLVRLAEVARRSGMLALEAPTREVKDEFLRTTMQMAIDGCDGGTIEAVMRAEMEATDLRHTCGKGLLESIGRFSPVFGMIGTLIGLVMMLGHMSDPSKIGPGMAVALLTTLYGLVIANVFCLPLARKLAHRSSDELLCKTIILKGVLAIQAGDHPRMVEQKLRAYLPAGQRSIPLRGLLESVPDRGADGYAGRIGHSTHGADSHGTPEPGEDQQALEAAA